METTDNLPLQRAATPTSKLAAKLPSTPSAKLPTVLTELQRRYPSLTTFSQAMNPDVQRFYGRLPLSDCIQRSAPTLRQLDQLYGPNSGRVWIVPQLTRIAEFCGQTARWSTLQMQELTAIILQQFGQLTVCELSWFFQHFKGGRYERFYGTPDPMVLTRSLRSFLSERNMTWQRIEQDRANEARRHPEGLVGIAALKSYLARCRQAGKDSILGPPPPPP